MNILVFDTETLGMKSQDLLNVGYRILDLNPISREVKVLCERDMIDLNLFSAVSKLFSYKGCLEEDMSWILSNNFLSQEKYEKYVNAIAQKKIERHSIRKIFEIMAQDMEKHKVVFGYAYNCTFDIDKFSKTASKYGLENPIERLPIFDIWAYAVNHICRTEDYIKWAKENAIFTASESYISTSVESVVKYLTNNLDFVEEHTALSDTQWETAILLNCLQRGCDITRAELKGSNIDSGKVFQKTIILPNGERVDFEYTKAINRTANEYYYEKK
jgi:hypothetical protein